MKKLDGKDILTVEGLADGDKLHPIQESFIVEGVMQCGFCTPGQIMAVAGLLRKTLTPTREEIDKAFKGVLCRCGSYPRVIKAIHRAAAIMRGDEWTDEKRVFDDVIGSSYPMVDAVGKVTGSLKYVDDYYVPGMLCGKIVWSEEPSAQLLGIDASEALAVPGVVRARNHARRLPGSLLWPADDGRAGALRRTYPQPCRTARARACGNAGDRKRCGQAREDRL